MDPITKDLRHLLSFIAKGEGAINEEGHSINFIISTDKLDRHSEIVAVEAIEKTIPQFADNPCCLGCHQHRLITGTAPVIGSWDTETYKARKHHSEMRLNFAVDTELGENYWKLYSKRHMRAVSIGFIPQEWHEEKDEKRGRHWIHTQIELIEISCVAVGANQGALAKLKEYYGTALEPDDKSTDNIERAIAKYFETLKEQLDERFANIEALITDGQDRTASLQLGSGFDLPDPAVDTDNSEQSLSRIKNAFNNFNGDQSNANTNT